MMRRLWALAAATYLEAVRTQIFVNLGVLAGFSLMAALVMDQLTIGTTGRVILDVGLALASLVGALLCTTLAVRTMGGEDDRRVLLTMLVRPVPRWEVLVGKYLGVVALAATNALGCTALAGTELWAVGGTAYEGLAAMMASLVLEAVVITAVTFLFSVLAGSTVAVVMGLGVYVAGLFSHALLDNAAREGLQLGVVARVLYHAIPNLAHADLLNHPPSSQPVGMVVLYLVLYSASALALAAAVFERRDLR